MPPVYSVSTFTSTLHYISSDQHIRTHILPSDMVSAISHLENLVFHVIMDFDSPCSLQLNISMPSLANIAKKGRKMVRIKGDFYWNLVL